MVHADVWQDTNGRSNSLKANLSLSTLLKSYVDTENVGGGRWVEVQFCSFLTH